MTKKQTEVTRDNALEPQTKQNRAANSAAVSMLIDLIERVHEKKETARHHDSQENHDETISIMFWLNIKLMEDNIHTLTKMIETQTFDY